MGGERSAHSRRHPLGGIALARAPANILEYPFQTLLSARADADRTEPGIRPSVQSIAYHQGSAIPIPSFSSHSVLGIGNCPSNASLRRDGYEARQEHGPVPAMA